MPLVCNGKRVFRGSGVTSNTGDQVLVGDNSSSSPFSRAALVAKQRSDLNTNNIVMESPPNHEDCDSDGVNPLISAPATENVATGQMFDEDNEDEYDNEARGGQTAVEMRGFVSRDVTPISHQFDTSPEGHRAGVMNSANED